MLTCATVCPVLEPVSGTALMAAMVLTLPFASFKPETPLMLSLDCMIKVFKAWPRPLTVLLASIWKPLFRYLHTRVSMIQFTSAT